MKHKIITNNGLTIDISEVKSIKHIYPDYGDGNNKMVVDFKTRYEYIFNPNTGKYVKQKFNDSTELVFPDFDTAHSVILDWNEIWQKYLDEQKIN